MIPVWIPIAVTAALFQCWRTALQQKLRHLLSVNGAGFVRFLYGAPTASLLLFLSLPPLSLASVRSRLSPSCFVERSGASALMQ